MDFDQLALLALLSFALFLFILGRPRYDVVSSVTLLLATFLGLVPFDQAFAGFSHFAVITVIGVFVISAAIEDTGILENLAYQLKLPRKVIWKQVGALCLVAALMSSVINNVGAVALLIPVALKIARMNNIPRKLLLMPICFSSLLGGMITLIGTPPNLIISQYRDYYRTDYFSFFDFTPAGLFVSMCGVAFITFFGWKLIPLVPRDRKRDKVIHEEFTVELAITPNSPLIDEKIAKIAHYREERLALVALIRDGSFHSENLEHFTAKKDDVLVLNTDKWTLRDLMGELKLVLVSKELKEEERRFHLAEITVLPYSEHVGKSVKEVEEDERWKFNIVAVSRRGEKLIGPLSETSIVAGDVLLIKAPIKITKQSVAKFDSLLIEDTLVRVVEKKQVIKVFSIFGVAIATMIAGLLNPAIAFISAAVLMIITDCISIEKAYRSISWPAVVLLGALTPVGHAMETTGLAKVVGSHIYLWGSYFPIWISLYALIFCSMLFANLMNSSAVAVVFAPIAATLASDWEASIDPFLMGIAIGASCSFLTPVGNQSNALIFGPGRYKFSDYWVMGLPLTLLISVIATIVVSFIWPYYR